MHKCTKKKKKNEIQNEKKNVLSTTTIITTICQIMNLINVKQQQIENLIQNHINDHFTTINGYHLNLYKGNKILSLSQLTKYYFATICGATSAVETILFF